MKSAHCWQSAACRKVRAGLEAFNPGFLREVAEDEDEDAMKRMRT